MRHHQHQFSSSDLLQLTVPPLHNWFPIDLLSGMGLSLLFFVKTYGEEGWALRYYHNSNIMVTVNNNKSNRNRHTCHIDIRSAVLTASLLQR